MALDLGLTEHHQAALANYMRFSRYQRNQCLKAVSSCFEDVKDTRLTDETCTREEVEELLNDLTVTIKCEVESELLNTSHTNSLLLRQLFKEAEQWHLKLNADTSELENVELLRSIKNFEDAEVFGNKKERTSPIKTKLEPIIDAGGVSLLQKKIDDLSKENARLKEQMKQIESQAISTTKEKLSLRQQLERLQTEFSEWKSDHTKSGENSGQKFHQLQQQLRETEHKMLNLESNAATQRNVGEDLAKTKHRLLELQAQLELTEKELEAKFSKTTAYNNMKRMLLKKNEQIKEVRRLLQQYEPNRKGEDEE